MTGSAYNVWKHTLHAGPAERLRAFAELYQSQWQRTAIREVMASLPVAMMWDDHELRDGWGSRPGDTDALVEKYPKGRPIYELFQAYYRDARSAFWHFQRCHGPIGPFVQGPATRASQSRDFGQWPTGASYVSLPTIARKSTVEYWFDVGAARIVMFDGRSARDYFLEPPEGAPDQPVNRVHGDKQWKFVSEMLRNLPRTTRAVVPVTSVPIVMNATDSVGEWFVGDYEPDVAEFKRGDLDAMLKTFGNLKHPDSVASGIEVVVTINWSDAQVEDLMRESVDDLRDGWQSARNLDEAGRLLRLFGALHVPGRPDTAMPVTFLGGDIHIGGLFEIRLAGGRAMECAIGSAIAKEPPGAFEAGAVIGTEVDYPKMSGAEADVFLAELRTMNPMVKSNILRGLEAQLLGEAIPVNNYAVTRIEFGTEPATIHNDIIPTRKDAELTRIYARLGPFSISTM